MWGQKKSLGGLEDFLAGETFSHAVCKTLVGIVRVDGHLTIEEYNSLVALAARFDDGDSQATYNGLVLQYIMADVELAEALPLLKKTAKEVPEEVRLGVMEVFQALLQRQGAPGEEHVAQVASALGLPKPAARGRSTLFFGALTDLLSLGRPGDTIEPLKAFGRAHRLDRLTDCITAYEGDPSAAHRAALDDEWERAREMIADGIAKFQAAYQARSGLDQQFVRLADRFIDQTRQRVEMLQKRCLAHVRLFDADYDDFIRNAMNEFEIAMRDRISLKELDSAEAWERFASTSGARALEAACREFGLRQGEIVGLLREDIAMFCEEMETSRKVLKSASARELAALVPGPSLSVMALGLTDRAADITVGVGMLGGVAIGALVAMGKFAALGTVMASPLAWAAVGATVAAVAYRSFSDRAGRRLKELKGARGVVEERLRAFLGNPGEEHAKEMEALFQKANQKAGEVIAEVTFERDLCAYISQQQPKVLRKICDETMAAMELLVVPKALPA